MFSFKVLKYVIGGVLYLGAAFFLWQHSEAPGVAAKWTTPMQVAAGVMAAVFIFVCVRGIVNQNRSK